MSGVDGPGRPGDTVGLREAPTCPQAWHAGLNAGLLRECKYDAGHRGSHRTDDGRLSWSGKLTDAERETAAQLRAALAAEAPTEPAPGLERDGDAPIDVALTADDRTGQR